METNVIIQDLRARASLGWNPEQQAWFDQQANDARPVKCVRMRDVFTPDQLRFLFQTMGYKTQQKMCYRNAAQLVERAEWMAAHFDSGVPEIKYVEGYAYCYGLLPIEHAFVKVGTCTLTRRLKGRCTGTFAKKFTHLASNWTRKRWQRHNPTRHH